MELTKKKLIAILVAAFLAEVCSRPGSVLQYAKARWDMSACRRTSTTA